MKRKIILGSLALVLCGAVLHAATDGRVVGEVFDSEGNPIEGVKVTLESAEIQFSKDYETNKKGKFTATLLDASRAYTITLSKEGYATVKQPLDPKVGTVLRQEWTLQPGTAEGAPLGIDELTGRGKAVKLYNEAAGDYQAGNLDKALENFEKALTEDPELNLAYLALARIRLERKEYEAARDAAAAFMERVPEEPLGARLLYDAYLELGQQEEAAALLEQMLVNDRSPATAARVFNVAVGAIRAQDFEMARDQFQLALEIHPELKEANLNLAQVLAALGDFEGSIANADLFLAQVPGHPRALLMKFISHRALGDEAAADEAFAGLKSADPEMVAEQLVKEGTAQFNANQTTLAVAAFEKAIEASPDHPKAHYMLGLCLAGSSTERAVELFKRFLELAPDDPDAATAQEMIRSLE